MERPFSFSYFFINRVKQLTSNMCFRNYYLQILILMVLISYRFHSPYKLLPRHTLTYKLRLNPFSHPLPGTGIRCERLAQLKRHFLQQHCDLHVRWWVPVSREHARSQDLREQCDVPGQWRVDGISEWLRGWVRGRGKGIAKERTIEQGE